VPSFLASVGPFQPPRPIFYGETPICHVTAGGGRLHRGAAALQISVSLEWKRQSSAFAAAAFQAGALQNDKMPKNKAIIAAGDSRSARPFLPRNREFLIRSRPSCGFAAPFLAESLKIST
jgi:hypothetical protein